MMGSWAAYSAAAWALIFAGFHIVWAMGWYVGLDAEMARRMFQVTWKYVYDIAAAGMCVLGTVVALAFVRPWGRRVPHRLLYFAGWFGTALLMLRSGASIAQMIYFAVTGKFGVIFDPASLWELWFYLGAILFYLSLWRFRRDENEASARPRGPGDC